MTGDAEASHRLILHKKYMCFEALGASLFTPLLNCSCSYLVTFVTLATVPKRPVPGAAEQGTYPDRAVARHHRSGSSDSRRPAEQCSWGRPARRDTALLRWRLRRRHMRGSCSRLHCSRRNRMGAAVRFRPRTLAGWAEREVWFGSHSGES